MNGTDKAQLIAGYAQSFETALREAGYLGQAPKPKPTIPPVSKENLEPAKPPAPVPVAKRGILAGIVDLLLVLFRGWR